MEDTNYVKNPTHQYLRQNCQNWKLKRRDHLSKVVKEQLETRRRFVLHQLVLLLRIQHKDQTRYASKFHLITLMDFRFIIRKNLKFIILFNIRRILSYHRHRWEKRKKLALALVISGMLELVEILLGHFRLWINKIRKSLTKSLLLPWINLQEDRDSGKDQ